MTKGGADVMAFVVGGKFSIEVGLELKSARWRFLWDFLQVFCDFLNFGMNLPRFSTLGMNFFDFWRCLSISWFVFGQVLNDRSNFLDGLYWF